MIVTLLFVCLALSSQPVSSRHSHHSASSAASPIKHMVVLMLENRAFDHVLGWYQGSATRVNGLTGNEFNYVNDTNTSSRRVFVSPDATYISPCDPDHSLPGTLEKVFGRSGGSYSPGQKATMGGFVTREAEVHSTSPIFCDAMQSFLPHEVPILSALASEFTLMDRFFASVPGPTWPNRAFFLAATSAGLTETDDWYQNSSGILFPGRTIFDQVTEAGGTWKIYYNDTPWELFMESVAHNTDHLYTTEQLWSDAREGTLPDFAFINPRCGVNMTNGQGATDQHPDHDLALGERFIKDVYEAIRSSPQWNETLLVVTYDEHGGFFDHVPIVTVGVPAPDNSTSYPDPGFHFDLLGVRIPTILVSPWTPKGFVVSDAPAAQRPTSTSEFDLTSIMATARKILPIFTGQGGNKIGPLTQRDAWSSTFEHAFNMTTPREDCPLHLPSAPQPSLSPHVEGQLPISSLQRDIITAHAHAVRQPFPRHLVSQSQVSPWLQQTFQQHHAATQRWKRSKTVPSFTLRMLPVSTARVAANEFVEWTLHVNQSLSSFATISAVFLDPDTNSSATYCLDVDIKLLEVGVSLCHPGAEPWRNSDRSQHFLITKDSTLRPVVNGSLCVSTDILSREKKGQMMGNVVLLPCVTSDASLGQHLSYYGKMHGWLGPMQAITFGPFGIVAQRNGSSSFF